MLSQKSDIRVIRVRSYPGISPKLEAAAEEFTEVCPDGWAWEGYYGDFDTRLFEKREHADAYAGCLEKQGVVYKRHAAKYFRDLCR